MGNLLVIGERSGGGETRVTFFRYLAHGEPRQDLVQNYFEAYASRDAMPPRLLQRPVNALNHIPDLYTEGERRTSLAYDEHLLRSETQNGLVVRLDELDSLRVAWSLGDPVGSDGWQSAHLRLIESLVPHVRQFVRVRQALAGAKAVSAGLAGLLDTSRIGVLHLDRGGPVASGLDDRCRWLWAGERTSLPGAGPGATAPVAHGGLVAQQRLRRSPHSCVGPSRLRAGAGHVRRTSVHDPDNVSQKVPSVAQ